MSEPIIVNFYDENDEVIKTFSRSRISWEFFKRAQSTRPPKMEILPKIIYAR